ncbi:ribonuclease HII [Geitlerinema sp. PCC 7407]|uniref:ribonuclease HII n=1 Tax=Geitlerinema sp. PCC 7407 TaxID=1173025 RepID=UPI00029FF753|nr:ribonuclease HII [Geitlerinema sp. PCC 7407]AFY67310.1 RNase HII [Geitlerinema sp. PCC 7407]
MVKRRQPPPSESGTLLPVSLTSAWVDQDYGDRLLVGLDEVGRGALFGPVVAAAVVLPPDSYALLSTLGVTDSKQLSATQRSRLFAQIQQVSLDCQIGLASVGEIDRLNILQASLLAMRRAFLKLSVAPTFCLVDGNQRIPHLAVEQQTLVQGDRRSLAIAAASIIAKVWRDDLIIRLAKRYPNYGLDRHKGYGTLTHRQALQQHGLTPQHRRSFAPCQILPASTSDQLPLNLFCEPQ